MEKPWEGGSKDWKAKDCKQHKRQEEALESLE